MIRRRVAPCRLCPHSSGYDSRISNKNKSVILKEGKGKIRLNSFLNRRTWVKRRLMNVTSVLNPAAATPPPTPTLPASTLTPPLQASKSPDRIQLHFIHIHLFRYTWHSTRLHNHTHLFPTPYILFSSFTSLSGLKPDDYSSRPVNSDINPPRFRDSQVVPSSIGPVISASPKASGPRLPGRSDILFWCSVPSRASYNYFAYVFLKIILMGYSHANQHTSDGKFGSFYRLGSLNLVQ